MPNIIKCSEKKITADEKAIYSFINISSFRDLVADGCDPLGYNFEDLIQSYGTQPYQ